MFLEVGDVLLGGSKRLVEFDLATGHLLLHSGRAVESTETVVGELKGAELLDHTVGCAAVVADFGLAALFVDTLGDTRTAQVVDAWASKLFKERAPVRLGEENMATVLVLLAKTPESQPSKDRN